MTPESAEILGASARWVGFLAAFLTLGACAFRFGVLRALPPDSGLHLDDDLGRAAILGRGAALLLGAALVARLYAQARGFLAPEEGLTFEFLGVILGDTSWGRGWLAQAVAAALAFGGFVAAARVGRPGWLMAATGASAVVLAMPLTGHAVAAERAGSWGYPLDVLHALGGGAWLGTLAVVTIVGLRSHPLDRVPPADRAARYVQAFSPIALAAATVAVLAGVILAFRYLDGSVAALWTSRYGRALLLKVGVLAGVMALGAYNWRVLRPRLGVTAGPRDISRSAGVELALGLALLGVTAVLVAMPMPGEE